MGAINMILDLLIKINKTKLNNMISRNEDYEIILKQSQKLDTSVLTKQILKQTRSKAINARSLCTDRCLQKP